MTVTPEQAVAQTRKWLGVPYKHQGRSRGGVDCCGLTIVVGRELGLFDYDSMWYAPEPDGEKMLAECTKTLIKMDRPVLGGIGVFWMVRRLGVGVPQHMGVFGDYPHGGLSLIHAYGKFEKVVEHRFDFSNQRKLVACFGFPGVKYDG